MRSSVMSRIRGTDTKPETLLRAALTERGVAFAVNAKTPVGRPDVVVESTKLAVFVDGCFWHGCPLHYVRPRTRDAFWTARLAENVARDMRQVDELEALGWRVVRVWEHEVFTNLEGVVERIVAAADTLNVVSWRVWWVEPLDEAGTQERRHLRELRGLAHDRFEEQARHTRKWRVPAARASSR
jgi:DNA mismatch endonuclease (patch repair protein)